MISRSFFFYSKYIIYFFSPVMVVNKGPKRSNENFPLFVFVSDVFSSNLQHTTFRDSLDIISGFLGFLFI